jgi:c-di-GMP phosphodiesterase
MNVNPFNREKLTEDILQEWQNLLNETADIFNVPAGLITRVDGSKIEILLSSKTDGNPYREGIVANFPNSGWYCEQTLKSRSLNLIPDALQSSQWCKNSAAVDLHIISYMGLPIERPDGELFGTVCFLDNKQNAHNEIHIRMVKQVKRMIELSLRIVSAKDEIDRRDNLLNNLSMIYPICSYCKKVREESGNWIEVEKYVDNISGAKPSHGICPQCYEKIKKSSHTV